MMQGGSKMQDDVVHVPLPGRAYDIRIGSGLIGRAWAIVFAGGGCDVVLYDSGAGVADKARALVAEGLDELAPETDVDPRADMPVRETAEGNSGDKGQDRDREHRPAR